MLKSLFDKVAGLKACNLIKNKLQHSYFPVKYTKFSRAPFTSLPWLFLNEKWGKKTSQIRKPKNRSLLFHNICENFEERLSCRAKLVAVWFIRCLLPQKTFYSELCATWIYYERHFFHYWCIRLVVTLFLRWCCKFLDHWQSNWK